MWVKQFLVYLILMEMSSPAFFFLFSYFNNKFGILVSGVIWPIQSMPIILQMLSKALPMTLSADSFRKVMRKGVSLSNPEVIMGIAVPMVWVVGLGFVSVCIVKVQR